MTNHSDYFKHPKTKAHRIYEALRAFYLDRRPGKEVAQEFGFSYGTFRNLCSEFSQDPEGYFFDDMPPVETHPPADSLKARILDLRITHQAVISQIERMLDEEGLKATQSYIARVIREAGLPRFPPGKQKLKTKVLTAAVADVRKLDLSPCSFPTPFGALFLFAVDLAQMDMDALVEFFPGSKQLPAGPMIRSLLALKLWGIGRPSNVMPEYLDQGLALFAGLNVIPKKSSLSEYTGRCDPKLTQASTHGWFDAASGLGAPLEGGESFDLDFHTIPYHGDQAFLEKHYVSKRSRRQLGVLTFLARDANARIFSYADTTVHKINHSRAIQDFIDDWKVRTGNVPKELVFDSGVTTQAQLSRLNEQGVKFITLRKRYVGLVKKTRAVAEDKWTSVKLHNIGRKYRNPEVLDQRVTMRDYKGEIRQIAVQGLGHDRIIFLITNQMDTAASTIIDRYARRMIIENVISDAIDFFHMDALSATVPMKVHVDVQLTIIASLLYRLLGLRVGERWETAETRSIYNELIPKQSRITITEKEIIVTFYKRAHNPLLINCGYDKIEQPIPWLGNKILRFTFK